MTHRYRSIDGLRGIAALGVVVFHLSINLKSELSELLPDFISLIFSYGYLGVPIFFVISGFVISLSVGDKHITPKYARLFIIRRSIRLDPTYWASIGFAIILVVAKNQILDSSDPIPSASTILAHMFYMQDLLAVEPVISVVYWTLCLEVQLYLFYFLTVWLSQTIKTRDGNQKYLTHIAIIILVGIYSVCVDYKLSSISIPGLFISNWHYFLIGVLVSNVVRQLPYSKHVLSAWILFEVAFLLAVGAKPYAITGVITCLFIYILWKNELLDSIFTRSGYQYLGKLSYSLYLVHPDIGWKIISFGKRVLHDHMSPGIAGMLFIAAILGCVALAHIFHVLFERPSLLLCSKLKKTPLKNILAEVISDITLAIRRR